MGEERHLHPLQILPLIGRYLFLLLLPLARGLLAIRSPYALYVWLRGAWFDLLIVLLIFLFSYFTWRCSTFCCRDGFLVVKNGLFYRREAMVPFTHITSLSVEAPFYLAPVRAKRVLIDTAGRTRKNPNFQLLMHSRDADALLARHLPESPANQRRRYRSLWRHLLFLSVFVSNTATGVLFLATAFNQTGRVIGRAFQQQLLTDLENLAGVVAFIPQTAALIALILLTGWGIAILRNLLNYIGFSVTRHPSRLHIRAGFPVRRNITCDIWAINYLDFRQSILSKLLRLYVVFIHCAGYGRRKYDKAVLLPAASAKDVDRITQQLLWELPRQPASLRPVKNAVWRYIRPPLCACALIPPAVFLLCRLFPSFADAVPALGLMALLPLLWWLLLSVLDRCSAGVGVAPSDYTLRYARGFVLHTVVIPKSRISVIRFRQSLFQRARGTCDLQVYTYHERRCHRVRQLPLKEAYQLLQI